MWYSLLKCTLLAAKEAAEKQKPAAPGFQSMLPFLLMVAVFFIFVIVLPNRRDRKKFETMLDSLRKNDKVITIGGMIGTVAEVSQDKKEVTLKVSDNTRIKFRRTAIQQVLSSEEGEGSSAKS